MLGLIAVTFLAFFPAPLGHGGALGVGEAAAAGVLSAAWIPWEWETPAALGVDLGCSFLACPLPSAWLEAKGCAGSVRTPHRSVSHRCAAATGCHGAPGQQPRNSAVRQVGESLAEHREEAQVMPPHLPTRCGAFALGGQTLFTMWLWDLVGFRCRWLLPSPDPPRRMVSFAVGTGSRLRPTSLGTPHHDSHVLLPPASPGAQRAAGDGLAWPLQPLEVGFFSI